MSVRHLQLVEREEVMSVTAESDEPKLRVAIATQDMKGLNAHFGSARKFAIYDVTPTASRFVSAAAFDDVSDESGKHRLEGDDRIGPKIEALNGCHLLFCLAIGGPSAAKVINARIHPVKLPGPEPIDGLIGRVQTMMSTNPPPWLRKVMGTAQPRSMDFLDEED
ncbi:nitrogen fixation protein NifX [Afifella marina DSM 2698]|uniref:Nitrogen fixation protein NifX n=2 Tax=Afifella marina TaxID=1080 RepID=A0A1G5N4Z4_AFIMA|nr:nitrogen fixation protein NifX [Afifella marina DSM 2698]MBK1626802.1 nitrogen fixation protein NifX [Afifella marina]MBK5919268.1 nitrogen fixation protein NifX [Afifella marina]RAI21308.1 nitrogen fixation protein NifX [Afifella marina DSM 2698]SCZ32412.1 nitrogen fixation protein NifX [Afifella marina DSM 2698]